MTAPIIQSERKSVCALCKKQSPLQNSHIIPEFFFRHVYDMPAHQFYAISTASERPETVHQKGFRHHLLCRPCEQKIGKFETYASGVFWNDWANPIYKSKTCLRFNSVKYAPFKLFLMSLLWRMSVSSLEIFREVSIGEHEEILRQAILDGNPLGAADYPCFMTAVKIDGVFHEDWIMQPTLSKIAGEEDVCMILICGILFCFFISRGKIPQAVGHTISPCGEFTLLIEEARNIRFLSDQLFRLSQAQQIRQSNAGKSGTRSSV